LTELEEQGRRLFLANGCVYCHSGFTRPQDIAAGLHYLYPRISEPGDYVAPDQSPNTFGSERTGPDLSNSGGFHPDDWHIAHYKNPRTVTPISVMPSFEFFSTQEANALIAFTQARTGKLAQIRTQHQLNMKQLLLAGAGLSATLQSDFQVGYPGAANLANLMMVDRGLWFTENPLPVTQENLIRGREIFRQRCIGCHGVNGDGAGAALPYLNPPAAAFIISDTARYGSDKSPGAYYWRILRGVPGTAMENFGTRLSVEDIWRVVLFLKTIPAGGLQHTPTPEMYIEWTGYPELYPWANCFYPDAEGVGPVALNYTDNTPPGIGDVAAMVEPGQVNPEYAVILYMVEQQQIPCSPTAPNMSALTIVDSAANRPTEGYARMGSPQLQFIPGGVNPNNYGLRWLETAWPKPVPTQ
jgi:mono/diheme cytochrome c family protein